MQAQDLDQLTTIMDVRHSHCESCIDFSHIYLSVCRLCSLFLLTCLMLKSNLVTCVSPGCAGTPLKRDIIAVTQCFVAEVALSKILHAP